MRKTVFRVWGTEISWMDITFWIFVAAFAIFYSVEAHRQNGALAHIVINTKPIPALVNSIRNHSNSQTMQDGEIKGQLEFLREQNVQIIEYLKSRKGK